MGTDQTVSLSYFSWVSMWVLIRLSYLGISHEYPQCMQGQIQRGLGGGGGGLTEPPFDLKFHFHGKFWIKFDKPGTFFLKLLLNKSILLPVNVCNTAG